MFEKADELMATYAEASEEFAKSANEFLLHVNLLPQAWKAYQQAMAAGGELRKILDTREETLRALMAQLEQAVNAPFGKPLFGERKADLGKSSAAGAGAAGMKSFP
jgi:exonuclease VII small subunit